MSPRPDVVLLLARHGHATSGPDHRWDSTDPLTAVGLEQADDLARHVAALERPPTRIVQSVTANRPGSGKMYVASTNSSCGLR